MKRIGLLMLVIAASLFTAVNAQPKHKTQKGVARVGLLKDSPTVHPKTNSETSQMNMQDKNNNANNNRRKSPNNNLTLKQQKVKTPPVHHMEEESSERTKHHKGRNKHRH